MSESAETRGRADRRQRMLHRITLTAQRLTDDRGLDGFTMDELAAASDADPLAFRLRHLTDERARATLERVTAVANAAPTAPDDGEVRGRGLGFSRYKNSAAYCAVVAEVRVDERVHVEEHLPSAYELAVELAEEALAEVGVQSGSGVIITGSVVTAGEARAMFGKDPQ